MPIRIYHIAAEGLGPLNTFHQDFQSLNLIYSPNEGGKTLLTEFLVSALFRKHWDTRMEGKGKVTLQGLDEKPITFSTGSSRKFEDYLDDKHGLPADLARLLVVKGSEPQIPGTNRILNKETLRAFLSEQRMLNQVIEPIQKSIQGATLEDGFIRINNQGKGKALKTQQERLAELDEQIQEVDTHYATGRLQELQQQLSATDEALETQERARRHHAYRCNQELQHVNQTLTQFDPETLTKLQRDIQDYDKAQHEIAKANEDYQKAEERASFYQWLQQVREHYLQYQGSAMAKPHRGWLVAGLVAFLGAFLATLLESQAAAITLLIIMAVAVSFYGYRYQQAVVRSKDQSELINLKERFYQETGQKLGSLADIDAMMESYRQAPDEKQRLQEFIANKQQEKDQLQAGIQQAFYSLKGLKPSYEEWQEQLAALRTERQNWHSKKEELEARLAELGVASADYDPTPAEESYSAERLAELREDQQLVAEQVETEEKNLAHIKSEIGALTGQNLANATFNKAYEALLDERERVQQSLYNTRIEVVAGKFLTDLVEELKQKDDEKIADALASDYLQTPLQAITNRYQGLNLDGQGNLLVHDRVADFNLNDLSTGAYEQVLLALRAGISARLLQQDRLFLWLDDALQNTDWQKRPAAVQYLADLAKDEWQITYLTMDDHIRDLFDRIGSATLPEDYQRIDLAQD